MQKQIKKVQDSLKKVKVWQENCINGKYVNNELIFKFLDKREKILNKTFKKLVALNKENLVNFSL